MGCGVSATSAKVKDFDPVNPSGRARVAQLDLSAGDEVGKQLTLRSWTATPIPGVPCPPNRSMHERHLMRMEMYADKIEKDPHELCVNVASKRLSAEILSEQILSEQTLSSERMTRSKPTRKFEPIRVR